MVSDRRGWRPFVADGYWLSRRGAAFHAGDEDNSVKRPFGKDSFGTEPRDLRLLCPGSMTEGPGGAIHVTASHVPEMKMWHRPGVTQRQLFRFQPGWLQPDTVSATRARRNH